MAASDKKQLSGKVAESGVTFNSGVIVGEEYNPKQQGLSALKAYDEMRRNDATVNSALDVVKLPSQGANFHVDAASEDQKDQDVASLVSDCLFHVVNWQQFVEEALTYLDFGFAVFEMVFEPRQINGQPRIALTELQFMKQTTVAGGEVPGGYGIKQMVQGVEHNIPGVKVVRFTHKQEGQNYEGRSVLRTAYKHWYIKDKLYRIGAVGHERQALGVIDVTVPKGASAPDKEKIKRAVRNLRANQESYLMHPEGWVIQFMDMKAKGLKDVEPSINHHDRQISKNVLAQFLEIGAAGSTGTRSTSEDHSSLLDLARDNIARKMVDVLQNTVVRAIVDLNFNDVEYPTLRVGKISDDNIPVISEAIAKFTTAGVLHPTPADENTTRKMIGWKEIEEDELQQLFESGTDVPAVVKTASMEQRRKLRADLERVLYESPSAAT